MITLVVDGAYSAKDDVGGWAAILLKGDRRLDVSGYELHSTNNRMELMATIMGLRQLKKPCALTIICDSKYVISGATHWSKKWIANEWRNALDEPIKNKDLWLELLALTAQHEIEWEHQRGHRGHAMNEQADKAAVAARLKGAGRAK